MTAARGERPSASDVGRRIRVLGDKVFAGRLGTIVEAKVKGRGFRLRVQLDNDHGYSWWFAPKELEVLPGVGLRTDSDPVRAAGVPGASPA
jgi:hypothetical protein